ncbi:galactose-1-epimerase [Eubacterium sp. An11]|uniref:aldose epimerase family protein n=1 Tax=Eubacterium sp. An11 TaxID=1965542 RepID=UPI000B38C97B|nr:aldose epimerase family protein [Eubacterium sp. An11]OUQ68875.1 galactose-1-epimerase [Eubacterium sp. An11]
MNVLDFGKTKDGVQTHLYTIKNEDLECRVTDFGSILVNLFVPDKHGKPVDVVLGFDTVSGYEQDTASLGCNVGRCANRIGGASFTLDGRTYTLDKNDGENCLHSGFHQYSKRIWTVTQHTDTSVAFSLDSPDMDQGFPGAVTMTVTYELKENQLIISYAGTPDKDTIINMTNHSYFNLNGGGNVLGHMAVVNASRFTPSDAQSIPTGIFAEVAGTPMDFREPKALGQDIGAEYDQLIKGLGYDHNYVIDDYDGTTRYAVHLYSEESGILMDLSTDYPGIQMYTANYLKDDNGKNGAVYHPRDAVCFEPQFFPDAINKPEFPSPVCKAGTPYHKEIIYTFSIDK